MPDYTRLDYKYAQHYKRYLRHVTAMPKKLSCQECYGRGGWVELVDPLLGGPWMVCNWCEGTGLLTSYRRSLWLKTKEEEKRNWSGFSS